MQEIAHHATSLHFLPDAILTFTDIDFISFPDHLINWQNSNISSIYFYSIKLRGRVFWFLMYLRYRLYRPLAAKRSFCSSSFAAFHSVNFARSHNSFLNKDNRSLSLKLWNIVITNMLNKKVTYLNMPIRLRWVINYMRRAYCKLFFRKTHISSYQIRLRIVIIIFFLHMIFYEPWEVPSNIPEAFLSLSLTFKSRLKKFESIPAAAPQNFWISQNQPWFSAETS